MGFGIGLFNIIFQGVTPMFPLEAIASVIIGAHMTDITELSKQHHSSLVFLFMDLELEYLAGKKTQRSKQFYKCLIRAQRVLQFARKNNLKIVHFRSQLLESFKKRFFSYTSWI